MSKVKHADDLESALDKAFHEDTQVLIEEFVSGREFSIGVYSANGEITVLPTTEVIPANEFFDFEAKYTPGATQEITPGNMSEEEYARVHQIIKEVYIKLNCRGVVRIDYFLEHETGKFYFIEINTMKQCHRNYKARSLGSMHSDPVFAEKGRAQEQLTVARLVVLGDFFLDRHFIIYSSSSSILPKLTKRPKFPTCRSRSMAFLVLLAAVLVVLSAQAVHVASQPG